MQKPKGKESGTQAVERALRILKCFMGENQGLSLTEIAQRVGLPVSTASRILKILHKEDFVQRSRQSKQYSLGKSVYLLGYCEKMEDTLRKVVYPYLVRLRDEFQETAIMYVRDGSVRRLYEKVEPTKNFRFTPVVGTEYHLWAGAGAKALLAFLDEVELEEIIAQVRPLTPKTTIDADKIRQEVLLVRQRGYACSFDEYNHGFTSLSGPVINGRDEALCAICVTGPSVRFPSELVEMIGGRLREYCMELSRSFGWPGPFGEDDWIFPYLNR